MEWRLFGDFRCERCGNEWPSAHTWIKWNSESNEWKKEWQACKKCQRNNKITSKVYPTYIHPRISSGASRSKKQHLTEYCHKCIELGRDCRYYHPPENPDELDEEDFPDDVSVRSDASNVDDLESDEGDRRTPVPSDEDAIDELLSSKLNDLAVAGP